MPKKNRNIIDQLKGIPEIKAEKKDVSKILQTLKEENKSDSKQQKINLSFDFLDRENELFNMGEAETEWFIDLMDTYKLLTGITKKQLFGEYKEKFKPHPYKDIEKLNFNNEMLTNPQYEAWQLRISKSKGRLHGFFVENTYYVIYIDRWHNMYDDPKYGGIDYKEYPQGMYEILETRCLQQEDENKESIQKNKELEEKLLMGAEAICNECIECPKVDKVHKFFSWD